ncbi:hypothetical protein [Umezawaea beigongshangensis]|uniref:hypothetical protein n=1 Tax=Umezawaea beigongshangensis TaxID=2780383 RepID=UPI0018F12F65|nr:hypothetical protein [Umezawaea beigongshangensis]
MFDRAVGADEPPLRVDFDAVEQAGARSLRRRRAAVPLLTAAAVVAAVSGAVALTGPPGGGTSAQLAAPGASTSPAGARPIGTAVPSTRTAAYCYRTADITSDEPDQHVMVGFAGDDPDGRGDVASRLLRICGSAWTENHYGWRGPIGDGKTYSAPDLVACVLDDAAADATDVVEGAAAVFPGTEQTCADLGLPVAALNG